jgi:hypothetical protein
MLSDIHIIGHNNEAQTLNPASCGQAVHVPIDKLS